MAFSEVAATAKAIETTAVKKAAAEAAKISARLKDLPKVIAKSAELPRDLKEAARTALMEKGPEVLIDKATDAIAGNDTDLQEMKRIAYIGGEIRQTAVSISKNFDNVKTAGGENSAEKLENKKPEVENKRMSKVEVPSFRCKDSMDIAEYKRQIENQQVGMNRLPLAEYMKNRDAYKENGRNNEIGGPAQEKARQEARADRITQNRENGMSRKEAEAEADKWMETQAALHDPDQVAGGNPENVTGMGDKEINSSIGSQWRSRVDKIDEAVQNYIKENNLSEDDCKKIYMNVKLEVAGGE